MPVLITADELADPLRHPRPQILDVRWRLGAPHGLSAFREEHIPGAVFVDLDLELAAPASPADGRHPLPTGADLQAAARRWGLRAGDGSGGPSGDSGGLTGSGGSGGLAGSAGSGGNVVVVYDDLGGMSAARAWWLLRWAGLSDVRILDGGLDAWRAAGLPLETGKVTPAPGDIVLGENACATVDPDDIAAFVQAGGLLLDARTAERYRGEENQIDPQFGHIPGAVSGPTGENLTAAGTFRASAELRARFEALGASPGRPIAVYCGSGVTAAHEIAALAIAGFDDVALYPGSWSQWAGIPGRPIATGPNP